MQSSELSPYQYTINLSRCDVDIERDLVPIAHSLGINPALNSLNIGGIHPLRKLPKGYIITPDCRKIPEIIAKNLCSNTTLEELDLNFCAVDYDAAKYFGQMLFNNSTLKILRLGYSSLNHNSSAITFALRANTTLTELDLSDNMSYSRRVFHKTPLTIDAFGASQLFESLKSNFTLRTLDISGIQVREESYNGLHHALALNSGLTSLNLSEGYVGDRWFPSLVHALHQNTKLTSLDLSRSLIGPGVASNLEMLIHANSTLKSLKMVRMNLTFEDGVAIGNALTFNNSLTLLDLGSYEQPSRNINVVYCNRIRNEGAIAIGEGLAKNNTLEQLILSYNLIGDAGAHSIAQGLQRNSSLTVLDLSKNSLGNIGAVSLGEALRVNGSLTTLNLSHNKINELGAVGLFNGLSHNTALTSLKVSSTMLNNNEAIGALVTLLSNNYTLTELNLSMCRSREPEDRLDLPLIMGAVESNTSLQTLDLSFNHFQLSLNAFAIGRAINVNSTLTNMNFNGNPFDVEGLLYISQAMENNSTLMAINMFGYDLDDARTVEKSLIAKVIKGYALRNRLNQAQRVNTLFWLLLKDLAVTLHEEKVLAAHASSVKSFATTAACEIQ